MTQEKSFEQHRHDFFMHYYDMATRDLDRHLNTGWQAITVIAGTIALLSLGHKNELPFPIAAAAALAVFCWALAHTLDANYWAIRAIAFLANVEAVYFAEEDRSATNPYIGRHPPGKLLDSLRHQRTLIAVLVGVTLVDYSVQFARAGGLVMWVDRLEWSLPAIVLLVGGMIVLNSWAHRLNDYQNFVHRSPGPGIVATRKELQARGVLLEGAVAAASQPIFEDLNRRLRQATLVRSVWVVAVIIFGLLLIIFIVCGKIR